MRVSYDRDVDVLLVEVSSEPITHAEEMGNFIVHFSADDKPVLMEILDASEFLTQASKAALTAQSGEFVDLAM
jgi:hypothetical protein